MNRAFLLLCAAACAPEFDAPAEPTEASNLMVSPAFAAESSVCFTLAPIAGSLAVLEVGMDSGTITERGRFGSVTSSWNTSGIGLSNDRFVAMAYNGNNNATFVVDLNSGLTRFGNANMGNVTAINDRIISNATGTLGLYRNPLELDNQNPVRLGASTSSNNRIALDGLELFTAWHSTDTVDVVHALTGAAIRTISLEGYDTWVHGMSVAGDMLHVIDDGRQLASQRIARFDPQNGTLINEVMIPRGMASRAPSGLWCMTP